MLAKTPLHQSKRRIGLLPCASALSDDSRHHLPSAGSRSGFGSQKITRRSLNVRIHEHLTSTHETTRRREQRVHGSQSHSSKSPNLQIAHRFRHNFPSPRMTESPITRRRLLLSLRSKSSTSPRHSYEYSAKFSPLKASNAFGPPGIALSGPKASPPTMATFLVEFPPDA